MHYPIWLIILLAVVFFLAGTCYVIFGIIELLARLAQRNWLPVEAKVLECESFSLRGALKRGSIGEKLMTLLSLATIIFESVGGRSSGVICLRVRYEYILLGQTYAGEESLRQRGSYQPGQALKCRINPASPRESAVQREGWRFLLLLCAGVILIGCTVGIFYSL